MFKVFIFHYTYSVPPTCFGQTSGRYIKEDILKKLFEKMHKYKILSFKMYGLRNINPLTSELNPSAQRCLTRFFTWDFAS
jgi:hypothetical protein